MPAVCSFKMNPLAKYDELTNIHSLSGAHQLSAGIGKGAEAKVNTFIPNHQYPTLSKMP